MQPALQTAMNCKSWLLLLLLSVLWGGSFFFIGIVVKDLSPLTIVGVRVFMAALILWCIVWQLKLPVTRDIHIWQTLLAMGILNNVVPFVLIVWGQAHIAAGLAAILNATTPLFTVLVAALFLEDEPINGPKCLGVGAGFCGVVVMIGPQALAGLGAQVLAQIAVLIAAMSYAFAGVYGRRFSTMDVAPIVVAAGQLTASALLLLPLAFWLETPRDLLHTKAATWPALIGLATLSTALAYVVYFRLLASVGATNVLLVTFLIPVSAIVLGFIWLDEQLQITHGWGMLLIGVGLLLIDGRMFKRGSP